MFNYQLIDCAEKKKLERFGPFLIMRSCPQATYKKKHSWPEADLIYDHKKWIINNSELDNEFEFPIYKNISVLLKKSGQGQIGIFPEQYENWLWLNKITKEIIEPVTTLNCFAYTGISTLFIANNNQNGKNIHLDGANSIVKWAQKNAKISKLEKANIAWITEDVLTFLKREVKRKSQYDGFVLDPPAFGRGPNGKIWKFEKDIIKLFCLLQKLKSNSFKFFLISAHDNSFNAKKLKELSCNYLNLPQTQVETGNLYLKAKQGHNLNSGYYARWHENK